VLKEEEAYTSCGTGEIPLAVTEDDEEALDFPTSSSGAIATTEFVEGFIDWIKVGKADFFSNGSVHMLKGLFWATKEDAPRKAGRVDSSERRGRPVLLVKGGFRMCC
jgi:hypothetical protein